MENDSGKILVAVHCLVFNHEPYIRQCLEGFVMQKTNFKFVAIVHDDASTDKTADVIREYEEKYPDVIRPIYETENQYSKHDGSLARIMNAAIDASGANYVAICEGDDYWIDPYKLQKQVDILETDDTLMGVVTNRRLVDVQGNTLEECCKRIIPGNKIGRYTLRQFFTDDPIYPTPSVMYRNNHPEEVRSMQAHTANAYFGDWTLWVILHVFGDFYFLNDVTAAYRINPTSVTHTNSRVGFAKALPAVYNAVADILPIEYADVVAAFRNPYWNDMEVAHAYRIEKRYMGAIGYTVKSLVKAPKYTFSYFKKKIFWRKLN